MITRRSAALSVLLVSSSICASWGFTVGGGGGGGGGAAFAPRGPPRQSSERVRGAPPSATALAMAQKRGRPRGPLRTIVEKPPMNDEIEFDELRVVVPNPSGGKDEALGVLSKPDALAKAKELGGLDLILINSQSQPPVCKIADYSKWRYSEEKKKKEKKKNSKATEVKEVKMSYKIDVHDYEVRKKNASKFIQQGNRVKCTIMFRGREQQHDRLGFELLERLAEDMNKICTMEGKPKREGRNLSCIMSPRAEILKAINDSKRAVEKAKKKKKEERLAKAQAATAATVAGTSAVAAAAETATATLTEEELGLHLDDDDDLASVDELLGGDSLTDELFG